MIPDKKYVVIISDPIEQEKEDEQNNLRVNNQDIYVTENGTYEPEAGFTGIGRAVVNVAGSEPNIVPLNVSPTTGQQVYTAGEEIDGFSPVTVSGVTSDIDSNIVEGNIKSGVSILGVSGNVVELRGTGISVSLTSKTKHTSPSGNYNAYTSVDITANLKKTDGESKYIITPTTSEQTISVPNGYCGFDDLKVNAVTSSIDANIVAGNIKNGVTILGVTGNYTGGGTTLPYPYRKLSINSYGALRAYSSEFGLDIGSLSYSDVKNLALAAFCYALVYNGNISFDNLTNVTGDRAFFYAFYNSNITGKITFNGLTAVEGSYCFGSAFQNSVITNGVEFNGLISPNGNASDGFYYAFSSMTGNVYFNNLEVVAAGYMFNYGFSEMKNGTVYFPKLKTVSGSYAFSYAFCGSTLTNNAPYIEGLFGSLESVTGTYAFRYGFQYNPHLSSVTFTKLSVLSAANVFYYAFRSCPNLTTLSFPALTSTSFGSATTQFVSMLSGCTGVTVHFPSNLQSVIGSWSSVTSGFGGTNITVLFDLTATS